MNTSDAGKHRWSFLCFHLGMGGTIGSTIYLWLVSSQGTFTDRPLLLPLIFGWALPHVLGWAALTVASPFVQPLTRRRFIAFVPALAAILLALARALVAAGIFAEDDIILTTLLAVPIQWSMIAYAASENLHPSIGPSSWKRGTHALLGWIIGASASAALTIAFDCAAGLALGALFLAMSGLTMSSSRSELRSPWIQSERSIGRFARLVDLVGLEKPARNALFLYSATFGLVIASLAWATSFWIESAGEPSVFLALGAGLFLLGWAMGSLKTLFEASLGWSQGKIAAFLMIGGFGAILLLAFDPERAVGAVWLVGISLGFVGRYCREILLGSLDRKGARLPAESEALIGTGLGIGLLLIGGLFVIGELTLSSSQPLIPLIAAGYLTIAFFCWRAKNIPVTERRDGSPDPEITSWRPFNCYAPGYAPEAAVPFVHNDSRAVRIVYEIPEDNLAAFRETMAPLSRIRRREGALQWRLSQNIEKPTNFTESYLLESWADYQEAIRHETKDDRAVKQRVFDLNDWDSLPYESHEALEGV